MAGVARLAEGYDWAGLVRRQAPLAIVGPDAAAALARLRGRQVYLAVAVTGWLEEGDPEGALVAAASRLGELFALGLSPVCPGLEGLAALVARGDDRIGLHLQALSHVNWMARFRPLMAASAGCVVAAGRHAARSRGMWEEARWFLDEGRPVVFPWGVPGERP